MPLVDRAGRPLDRDAHVGLYGPGEIVHYEPHPDDDFDPGYGIAYREGLLSEHAESFLAAGGKIVPRASDPGKAWAILSDGRAVPVVCSDLIEIRTEDGLEIGRCGLDAVDADPGMCEGHAADYRRYTVDNGLALDLYR